METPGIAEKEGDSLVQTGNPGSITSQTIATASPAETGGIAEIGGIAGIATRAVTEVAAGVVEMVGKTAVHKIGPITLEATTGGTLTVEAQAATDNNGTTEAAPLGLAV